MENYTETEKNCTFEADVEPVTAENWTGGYNENGEYTGDGEYDENGKYVGAKPKVNWIMPLKTGMADMTEREIILARASMMPTGIMWGLSLPKKV